MPLRVLLVAGLALALAVPASAQPRRRGRRGPSGPIDRYGFVGGFSVGTGVVAPDACSDCGVGFSGEAHVGAMAGYYSSVAVMLVGGGTARSDVHHVYLAAAAQWWPDPWERFWLRGGVGIGEQGYDGDDGREAAYPTVLGAAGFEVIQTRRFAADILLQGVATHEPGRWGRSLSFNIGFNWY